MGPAVRYIPFHCYDDSCRSARRGLAKVDRYNSLLEHMELVPYRRIGACVVIPGSLDERLARDTVKRRGDKARLD